MQRPQLLSDSAKQLFWELIWYYYCNCQAYNFKWWRGSYWYSLYCSGTCGWCSKCVWNSPSYYILETVSLPAFSFLLSTRNSKFTCKGLMCNMITFQHINVCCEQLSFHSFFFAMNKSLLSATVNGLQISSQWLRSTTAWVMRNMFLFFFLVFSTECYISKRIELWIIHLTYMFISTYYCFRIETQ